MTGAFCFTNALFTHYFDTIAHLYEEEDGLSLSPTSLTCFPCRCKRNLYHKTTTATKEENKQTIIIVEDRSSFGVGRGITPSNENFKPNQTGSIAICDTGWGRTGKQITPEETEEKLQELKGDMKEVKKDIHNLKNNVNMMD